MEGTTKEEIEIGYIGDYRFNITPIQIIFLEDLMNYSFMLQV